MNGAEAVIASSHPNDGLLRADRFPHILCPGCGIGTVIHGYAHAIAASGAEYVTVAVRRVGLQSDGSNLYDALRERGLQLLRRVLDATNCAGADRGRGKRAARDLGLRGREGRAGRRPPRLTRRSSGKRGRESLLWSVPRWTSSPRLSPASRA